MITAPNNCKTLPLIALLSFQLSAAASDASPVPTKVATLLETYCFSCHDADLQKGEVRLDHFDSLGLGARLELLNRVQEQLFVNEMPPPNKKQPTAAERRSLGSWVNAELKKHNASKLEDKLRYPSYGNYVDHDKLFSGDIQAAPSTPARRWLVSPQIFTERVLDVLRLEGRERDGKRRGLYGVNNPFLLPEHSGVRDYDNTTLDGGHLLQMLANADWISTKQIHAARVKAGEIAAGEFPNPRDRWAPRTSPAAFEAVITGGDSPDEKALTTAIKTQFELVLQRQPTSDELAKYLDLTRTSIALGGKTEGLRRMLLTVLLESEFLYRLEFGEGNPDRHGRKKLSPREASFAISYALGDRGPDEKLRQAAAGDRLLTREDYHREITRLLDDGTYYAGQVDRTLDGKHYKSNITTHPKIVRFFREFFAYPGSLKVFKDNKRSGGKYNNPGRGTQATPGWLTYEADKFVTLHVENDRDVFKNLLTSDKFFVYDNMPREQGDQLLSDWRSVYEKLKNTPWKTEPERVLEENLEFLKSKKTMRIADASRPGELVNYMHFFDEHFGRGINPFTRVPWSHGYTYHHSVFYSLPPTPSIGRYGSWKSTKLNERIEDREFWDYPTQQPFPVAHRKGILTHPAWLIAHSTNFHADAVRRGKWIREKLLAGRVPDLPITVDAQVPEDPHRTFRQRVEEVTAAKQCWKCHRQMNPLGLPFESYDDFGRFRTVESLEYPENLITGGNGKTTFDIYKTAPITTTGALSGTGDPRLDGDVTDALDLIDRIARSDRARQSIIRYAFRFYLGRNETLTDSKTLIDADRAYTESGGSFKSVILSLLTSDSFMYRK
ncbi:MAG: DUF1588 domain-containing protein [Verrucomicrobiales bacterium]|nr:DUF1588 domain-containing protein [Verrucomicrobiales bacterium]